MVSATDQSHQMSEGLPIREHWKLWVEPKTPGSAVFVHQVEGDLEKV